MLLLSIVRAVISWYIKGGRRGALGVLEHQRRCKEELVTACDSPTRAGRKGAISIQLDNILSLESLLYLSTHETRMRSLEEEHGI